MYCSGCDLNTPRRAGPGGRGGEEAHDEQTPLHLCCQWGLESVVQTLVQHGANINVKVIRVLRNYQTRKITNPEEMVVTKMNYIYFCNTC